MAALLAIRRRSYARVTAAEASASRPPPRTRTRGSSVQLRWVFRKHSACRRN